MTASLKGHVALITGAGRGIGRELALRLGVDGVRVVVNDLDRNAAESTAAMVRGAGGEAVTCLGSVTNADFAETLVRSAQETFGGLDVVVNNAGYPWDAVVQRTTDEQFQTMLDLHLVAAFRILRAAQPVLAAAALREREAGLEPRCRKVVNISSIAGLDGNVGQVGYAAAKAGLTGLTKTLAKEWGRYNIVVNTVAYGLISTRLTENRGGPQSRIEVDGRSVDVGIDGQLREALERQIPLGRPGTPQEAAGAAYLLCRPEANYISGQVLVCAGGLRM